jgi:hypothetical protein
MSAAHLEQSPDLSLSVKGDLTLITCLTDTARNFTTGGVYSTPVAKRIAGEAETTGLFVKISDDR